MSNGNQQFAVMIWLVNLVIGAALLFFGYRFLLLPPSPTMPSYVPQVEELPEFQPVAAQDWKDIEWTRRTDAELRNVDWMKFARLHNQTNANPNCDWSRRESVPVPGKKPPPVDTTPPPVKEPTLDEARADLQGKITVRAFMGPSRVLIVMNSAPNDEYTLVGPAEWNRYVAAIVGSNTEGAPKDPSKYSGRMLNDMRGAGLPMRVLRITHFDWLVAYDYKGKTFEIPLGPPQSAGVIESGQPTDGPSLETVFEGGGTSTGGRTRPNPNPNGNGGAPPVQPTNPEPEIKESYEESPGTWVIAPDEVVHVRENMSQLIEDLKPKSVYNPEKREYEGIEMTNVPEESLAHRRGFVKGDVIISINGQTVRSVTDVKNYVRNNKNLPQYVVVFERNGRRQTRTFRIPQKK